MNNSVKTMEQFTNELFELHQKIAEFEASELEHKQVGGVLRENEKLYHILFNSAYDAIFVHQPTPDGFPEKFLEVNDVACERYGYTKEELMNLTPLDLSAPEKADSVNTTIKRLFVKGDILFETVHIAKGGKRIPVEIHSHLFPLKGKHTVISVARDITKRKRAEEALQESEEKYRMILENIADGYYEVDLAGNMTFFNDSLCEMTRTTKDELMGMNNRQYMDEENGRRTYRVFNEVYNTGKPIKGFECEIMVKDGTKRHVEISISLIKDAENKRTGFRGIMRDITSRKRAEEVLRKREMDLEIQNVKLEETNIALKVLLKKREEDKTEVEDKVLLNVKELISPYIEKLNESGLNQRQKIYLDILESNVNEIISPFMRRMYIEYSNLTSTEIKVANLVIQGHTTKEIAELMNLSPRTIESHRNNLRKKIGLKTKKESLRSHLLSFQ